MEKEGTLERGTQGSWDVVGGWEGRRTRIFCFIVGSEGWSIRDERDEGGWDDKELLHVGPGELLVRRLRAEADAWVVRQQRRG